MRKSTMVVSLAVGLASVGAPAFAQTTGHFGLDYNYAESNGFDSDAFGVSGAVSIPTGGSLAVILDGSIRHNSDADVQTFTGTAHLMSRNANQAFGGFAGMIDTDGSNAFVVGGEYANFFRNSTLALGGGYGNSDDADIDLFGVNGDYRLFLSDDFRLDFGLGLVRADGNGGDANIVTLGFGGEYRLPNSPISIGASYDRLESDDINAEVNFFAVGVKFDFGNSSLKSRDRSGSSTFNPLGGFRGALSLF